MKTLVRVLLSVICIGMVIVAVSVLSHDSAEATNPQSVVVSNTPLPVQGTVSVGNTASVNVANTPSVTVANSVPISGNVSVVNAVNGNSQTIPLLVAPLGQPYHDNCSHGPFGSEVSCSLKTLPANMRLVVQEVDMEALNASGDRILDASLAVTLDSVFIGHFVPLTEQGTDTLGNTRWVAHQSTTMYADGNTSPTCAVFSNLGPQSISCSISGYLVATQ